MNKSKKGQPQTHIWLTKKRMILGVLLIVIITAIIFLEEKRVKQKSSLGQENLKDGKFPKAPELVGISGYINSPEGLTLASLQGKVVLLDIWTYTCINCVRTLPYLVSWHEKYADDGLVIIGLHAPEFEFEKEYDNVLAAVQKYGIKYPVLQDNDFFTWRAYQNRYWPRKYLIDTEGYIRYDHIGEGGYEETEKQIQMLLKEAGMKAEHTLTIEEEKQRLPLTPELYAGYDFALPRGQDIGNTGGMKAQETYEYTLDKVDANKIHLIGLWQSNADNLRLQGAGIIVLPYIARSVHIVADSKAPTRVDVLLDGQPLPKEKAGKDILYDEKGAYMVVDAADLYTPITGEYGNGMLELHADSSDFIFSAFTFG